MEKKEGLLASVRTLHGVGDVRASQYAAMGVETLEDLVRHYPRAYENRGEIFALCDAPEDTRCALLLTVMSGNLLTDIVMLAAAAMTLYSMVEYVWQNRAVLGGAR